MHRLARLAASSSRHAQRSRRQCPESLTSSAILSNRFNSSDATTRPPSNSEPEKHEDEGQEAPIIRSGRFSYNLPFPDLMKPEPLFDLKETTEYPLTQRFPHRSRLVIRNDPSMFLADKKTNPEHYNQPEALEEGEESELAEKDDDEEYAPFAHLSLNQKELAGLHMFPLIMRRVTQQTGKGKIHRMYSLVVVGNGNGLVGYGEGKDEEVPRAVDKAFLEAVRNMDTVDRFETRTIWTEMESKMGATHIILRPRPVGFGLHCNPNIHQVLKAAGIKDISAKVWGSRNPLNVIKLLFRMLQAGNAPLAMGDGIGGRGRKLDRGSGVRGKQEIERERGRKLLNLRTW
ncbi:hypothetical protein EW146_g4463 [Bondarzewia mesenterica]|uniref:Small ribosomal subunit protein uS5m n=1 Tax=Bondarzewia mesenterica TaxID=1095465 RepID=A0A4S4LWD5_9AGAM|nr:hypothetical protein EW146_g4463 [Bondarzewia mesenterica]